MIVFPGMIAEAARKAGMAVPPNPDGEWDAAAFPHFYVFCTVQLGRPILWGEHWENAQVVAEVPSDQIEQITLEQLIARGLAFQT